MSDDQDECMKRIEPLFGHLHAALHEGMHLYQSETSAKAKAQHRDRTAAGAVYDHAFHSLRERAEGLTGLNFLNINQLEVANYLDRAVLRLKKVNGAGRSRNYQTEQQQRYDDQEDIPGIPPAAVRLVVGYEPDESFTSIKRVIVARPMGRVILWTAQIVVTDEAATWEDITPARFEGTDAVDFRTGRRRWAR
jgi:hypothetical protein